jgi:MscS family membrane protein
MIEVIKEFIQNEYVRALIIFIFVFFISRLFLFVFGRVALRIAKRTPTNLDEELIHRSSFPLTILAFLFSLRITLEEVTLEPYIEEMFVSLIYTFIVFCFAYLIYVVVNTIVIHGIKKVTRKTRSNIDDSIVPLINGVLNISIIVLAILYVASIWGIQIAPLLAGLGIAGIAVALALQPILSNIFSGVAMILDQSVRVNDLVYLDEKTKGRIMKIGIRTTKIKTFDNELVIVPNNKLAESIIQNVALPEPKSRAVVPFSVAYGSDIAKVKKIVLKELNAMKIVEKTPEPMVRFIEMADSGLNFKAYYYVSSFENRFESIDEANTRIYNALNKSGIEIPFPQMDVYLRKKK